MLNIIESEMHYFELPRHALSGFFKRAVNDTRLLPTHISLFAAIFYFSSEDDPGNPFQVSRSKLMCFSRIRSIATYHKCTQELVAYSYIRLLYFRERTVRKRTVCSFPDTHRRTKRALKPYSAFSVDGNVVVAL